MTTVISGLTAERMMAIEALVQASGILDTVADVHASADSAATSADAASTQADLALTNAEAAADSASHVDEVYANVDTRVNDAVLKPVALPAGANLNDYFNVSRVYSVYSDTTAAGGVNFPYTKAGILQVFFETDKSVQIYLPFDNSAIYRRALSGGIWTSWKKFLAEDDTGWVDAVAAGFTAVTANFTLTNGLVRKRNGMVSLSLNGTLKNAGDSGNIANIGLVTAPTAYRPLNPNGALSPGGSGSAWTGYIGSDGVITMATSAFVWPAGYVTSIYGTYML